MAEPTVLHTKYRGALVDLLIRPWKKSDANVATEVFSKHQYERRDFRLGAVRHWLDAGGHIGCFAIAAALSGCTVDSFEPEPDNAALYVENTMRNGVRHQVTLHQAALLSSTAGEVTLHLAPRSTSFHTTMRPLRGGRPIQVPAQSFVAFLRSHPSIDGVKMDVQGAEMAILENLCEEENQDALAQLKQLVFEWDFEFDNRCGRLWAVIVSLERAGFAVRAHKDVYKNPTWDHWPSGVMVWAQRPESRGP